MDERRYQVFISSTFRDLVAERQAVLLSIQRLNHLPAGMELFPSANDAPWDVIERMIGASDYYVLIIGGRYGSTDPNGISFTEREYDLAYAKEIPVLAFLHAEPGKLPAEQCDMDIAARSRLDSFRDKIEARHHCDYWRTPSDLSTSVVVGLVNQIAQDPKPGWVRGNLADDQQLLLTTLEKVRRENDELKHELDIVKKQSEVSLDRIEQGGDPVLLQVVDENSAQVESLSVTVTWQEVFDAIAYEASSGITEDSVKWRVGRAFFKWNSGEPGGNITDECVRSIRNQLVALGLLDVEMQATDQFSVFTKSNYTRIETLWRISEKGRRLYALSQAALRDN